MDGWLDAAVEGSPPPVGRRVPFARRTRCSPHAPHDRLGTITVPTLVTVGELDLVLPPRYSRELASRIPGARLEIVPEAGHQPVQELPQLYNALLAEFWASS